MSRSVDDATGDTVFWFDSGLEVNLTRHLLPASQMVDQLMLGLFQDTCGGFLDDKAKKEFEELIQNQVVVEENRFRLEIIQGKPAFLGDGYKRTELCGRKNCPAVEH